MITVKAHKELLPHLFREEFAKMTAVLCRHFGLTHIELAEDIASDTFLKASEMWAIHGVPENPTSWLYTVAKNKTKDHFKHIAVCKSHAKNATNPIASEPAPDFEFTNETIADSQLAMLFAVCKSTNSTESQICLSLQILCGFSVEEIASAFLTKTETIKKRLQRARINLRNDNFQITTLSETEINLRLETILKTLYLLFNEGYFSKTSNSLIRKDLCSEAIRLTLILTENPLTNTPKTNALLALMCYQSSRLDARVNDAGHAILFEEQDKRRWDTSLIEKGNYFLVRACSNHEISSYHLEASIAYWHTSATNENKWQHILQLYNQLILIEYSPITALNRMFAFAQVYGVENALQETEKLTLTNNNHYYSLLGYFYSGVDIERALNHYQHAIRLTKSKAEKTTLTQKINQLKAEAIKTDDFKTHHPKT